MRLVIETFKAIPDWKWVKVASLKVKFKNFCYTIPTSVEDYVPEIVFDTTYTVKLNENGEVIVEIDNDSRNLLEKRGIIIPFWEECLLETIKFTI